MTTNCNQTAQTEPARAGSVQRLVRRFRRFDWWLDCKLWFRLGLWTRKYAGHEHYNRSLAGLNAFAWAKYCGYGFRHAWHMGMIYWRPSSNKAMNGKPGASVQSPG